jgi:hypothetical protein
MMSRLPHFVNIRLTDGGMKLSALRAGRPALSLYNFCLRLSRPRSIVRLEGLGELEKSNDLIGNVTCDFPACSIVPQPTALPRALLATERCMFLMIAVKQTQP